MNTRRRRDFRDAIRDDASFPRWAPLSVRDGSASPGAAIRAGARLRRHTPTSAATRTAHGVPRRATPHRLTGACPVGTPAPRRWRDQTAFGVVTPPRAAPPPSSSSPVPPPTEGTSEEKPTKRKRPWYLRWWAWVIYLFVLIGVVGSLAGLGGDPNEESTAPTPTQAVIAVPDVAGQSGDEAQTALSALGLSADFLSDDGSAVLAPSNWTVVSTDPAAGAEVAEGATVTVNVTKPLETTPLTEDELDAIGSGINEGQTVTLVSGETTPLPADLTRGEEDRVVEHDQDDRGPAQDVHPFETSARVRSPYRPIVPCGCYMRLRSRRYRRVRSR